MRKPSRMMPPSRSAPMTWQETLGCSTTCAVIFAGLAFLCPVILIIAPAIVVIAGLFLTAMGRILDDRLSRLAAERPGESICTFARSFDYRTIDTWVIRAVFEGLQPCCRFRHGVLSLRADDDFDKVLSIDDEDLEDLVVETARRAGRSFDDYEKNPFYGSIRTPRDLVHFLVNQPRVASG
ncbi:hypothetical protein [Aquisphaera insulae]|uniref:hypothetical protein n=1 Tax=Aquisphaera insulae TaxID=2712864 RepID=UPI0013ED4E74|nr:hypothetical protein [Aquisphaera insulae]